MNFDIKKLKEYFPTKDIDIKSCQFTLVKKFNETGVKSLCTHACDTFICWNNYTHY